VSSYTGSQGNCVEVGTAPADSLAVIAVRDTKDRDGVVLRVSAETWSRFTEALR
jgi:hypothetical protein